MKRTWQVFGLVLGLVIGLTATVLAQTSNKVTATGFAICADWPQKDVTLTGKIDGAAVGIPLTATWATTPTTDGKYTATIPIESLPASARTVGDHTVIVSAPDVVEILADNSKLTASSVPVTVTYRVVSVTGQGFSNVKLVRVSGSVQ